jgi:DNA-binding Lrp family transcriptional regulator
MSTFSRSCAGVRRLKEDGVITQTVALIDPARLGMTVEVYAFIALENQRTASGQQFETMLRRRPGGRRMRSIERRV